MRIARPLRSSAAALALLALPGATAGQDASPEAAGPAARAGDPSRGAAAMERLREALARRRPDAAPPQPPPARAPAPALRRRAFEAMKKPVGAAPLEARARAALDAGEAAMAKAREEMGARLRQALGLEAPDMAALTGLRASPAASAWVPVLFVSSSMPVATLRRYAAQLERVRGVLAFRGMPGGLHEVGPMAKLSAEILRRDPGCEGPACAMRAVQLIVDPIVFRQHGVEKVPALSMIPGDPTQPYCERDEESARGAHVIFGDAALSGLLEEYARLGGEAEVRDARARLQIR